MLPDEQNIDIALHRLQKAKDCLTASEMLLNEGLFSDSANRSYYAIFHSMNALLILKGKSFKKHSGVISNFNLEYIKTGIMGVEFSAIAKDAFTVRNNSDYSDFYVVSKKEVAEQHSNAKRFVDEVTGVINKIVNNK